MSTFCDYYNKGQCRSCQIIELSYTDQLKQKEQEVQSAFPNFSALLPSVQSAPQNFRHRAKFVVTGKKDSPIIGLAGEEELDSGRELLDCPLHHPSINKLTHMLPDFIKTAGLTPYNIKDRSGELKGIIIFSNYSATQMYLKFILRSKESLDRIKKHQTRLLLIMPELKLISANIQPIPHAILEGEEEIVLTTDQYIWHNFKSTRMLVGTNGFIQTNPVVAEVLYSRAAEWIQEFNHQKMVELYCGYGAFSFFAQKYLKQSVGIEINASSIEVANLTKQKLALTNMTFIQGPADGVQSILEQESPDLILVNPPRRGLASATDLIKNSSCRGLIYSSCSLETLKKDIENLKGSFELKKVQVFDMFPHTKHFEVLTYLERL
ncbi:MAG: methyltransferase domain-containing protein [Bacteriovoracaceae bacterium]|jgi:23S rRNA (uracil747-C5)-methyltransferase